MATKQFEDFFHFSLTGNHLWQTLFVLKLLTWSITYLLTLLKTILRQFIIYINVAILVFEFRVVSWAKNAVSTGKSLSEAFDFASTNPQYDEDCSLNYKFNTCKIQAQTWGEHVVYRYCFWHSEIFLYTTGSPHVLQKEELLTKIYL